MMYSHVLFFQGIQNIDKLLTQQSLEHACADLEGVWGGIPQLEFAKLNIADITGNEKKLVIFHICALPQLYVKVGPPGKIFWIRA